ncbi:MAG: glycosyltransferase, partial [Bacteroidota bacterium]
EVLIVDDGSKDNTVDLLQTTFLPLSDNRVQYKIIPLVENQGKGRKVVCNKSTVLSLLPSSTMRTS